jgi:hypothetical protein
MSTHAASPEFAPDAWNAPGVNPQGANCYQYAFAGSAPDGSNRVYDEAFPIPGDFSGKTGLRPQDSPQNLTTALALDGITVLAGGAFPPEKEGMYLVGVYLHAGEDVHFVRQDRDGGWSDKYGVGGKVDRWIPPEKAAALDGLPERFGLSDYTLVGYAYAPREGINLGPEKAIAQNLQRQPDGAGVRDFIQRTDPSYLKALGATLAKYSPTDVVDHFNEAVAQYSAKPPRSTDTPTLP